MGVGLELEAGQRLKEVARTYLTSSTRAMHCLGKAQFTLFTHAFLSGDILLRIQWQRKISIAGF
ncbi:MAG: hypothetical protein ABR958_08710 [Dehalococcoidales bacterium]